MYLDPLEEKNWTVFTAGDLWTLGDLQDNSLQYLLGHLSILPACSNLENSNFRIVHTTQALSVMNLTPTSGQTWLLLIPSHHSLDDLQEWRLYGQLYCALEMKQDIFWCCLCSVFRLRRWYQGTCHFSLQLFEKCELNGANWTCSLQQGMLLKGAKTTRTF